MYYQNQNEIQIKIACVCVCVCVLRFVCSPILADILLKLVQLGMRTKIIRFNGSFYHINSST